MSEENELRVKFVIDDADFRDQLDRLRGDLERERRLEPGDVERPPQQPPIQIMIGGDGRDAVDDTVIRRIDELEKRDREIKQFKVFELIDIQNHFRAKIEAIEQELGVDLIPDNLR